jgi:maleate isomerase
MSFILGPTAIRKELKYGFPSALPTDMFEAQVEALKVFRVSRVALLTPYIEEVSNKNALMLSSEANVQVVSRYTMNLSHDYMTSNVSLDTIIQHVLNINCSSAQIIVIGCSAFRICEPGLISELERMVGKPVITSTQAYLWWMLRMAGVNDRVDGYGTLFSDY